jgi:hypothetical protein
MASSATAACVPAGRSWRGQHDQRAHGPQILCECAGNLDPRAHYGDRSVGGESSALGLDGKRRGLRSDYPRQLDAQLGQRAGRLNMTTRALDQILEQLAEPGGVAAGASARDTDACCGQRREDRTDCQPTRTVRAAMASVATSCGG